jgi:hypothetical protein
MRNAAVFKPILKSYMTHFSVGCIACCRNSLTLLSMQPAVHRTKQNRSTILKQCLLALEFQFGFAVKFSGDWYNWTDIFVF